MKHNLKQLDKKLVGSWDEIDLLSAQQYLKDFIEELEQLKQEIKKYPSDSHNYQYHSIRNKLIDEVLGK